MRFPVRGQPPATLHTMAYGRKRLQKFLTKEAPEGVGRRGCARHGGGGRKGEGDVLREIVARAEKAKREGTLSNAEIDAFVSEISPVLDAPKRRRLQKIAEKLKRL